MLVVGEEYNGGQSEPSQAESNTPRVLLILASVLERLVARNDLLLESRGLSWGSGGVGLGLHGSKLKVFDGVRAPNISIPKYLERLYKYTNCSASCFVVGYVYIDRLVHRHPEMLIVSLNVHRLLVTSLLVASKMFDDVQYNNAFYARVGGVSNPELNRLEMELLFLLDFDVMVSSPVFESYCWHLEKAMLRCNVADRLDKPPVFDIIADVDRISLEETEIIAST